jgi:cytochrome P450
MPQLFFQPFNFSAERWHSARPNAYEYLPFGAGVHACIGRRLATLELKLILVMLPQRFSVAVAPGARVDLGVKISLVPKRGLPITVRTRHSGRGRMPRYREARSSTSSFEHRTREAAFRA